MNVRHWTLSFVIISLFYISTHLTGWLNAAGVFQQSPEWVRFYLPYAIWTLTIIGFFTFFPKDIFKVTGLGAPVLKGLLMACVFVSPMVIGFLVTSELAAISPSILINKALLPGFFEELMFRGFLVGALICLAKWHFLPAALVSAVLFGIGHWFQGATPVEALLASVFTGVGGLWFAWLFVRWNHNLWLVASLHTMMNACWVIWDVDNTAIGGNVANILRMSTIVLSIAVTVVYSRRMASQRFTAANGENGL